jgi:hypothetical protein
MSISCRPLFGFYLFDKWLDAGFRPFHPRFERIVKGDIQEVGYAFGHGSGLEDFENNN